MMQASPQLPQSLIEDRVSTSQPLLELISQSLNPASHWSISQVPLLQSAVAFGGAHTELQALQ
jgi:hypothetical protein